MSAVLSRGSDLQNLCDAKIIHLKMVMLLRKRGAAPRVIRLADLAGKALVIEVAAQGFCVRDSSESSMRLDELDEMLEHAAVTVLKVNLREMEKAQQGYRDQLPKIVAWFAEHVFFAKQFAAFREFKRIVEDL